MPLVDRPLLDRWTRLIALRDRVLARIEPLRKHKKIGSSLQAKVILSASDAELALLQQYAGQLPMLFIVSSVDVRASTREHEAARSGQAVETTVEIERAPGVRCERCWRYVEAVSADPAWAGICERCQNALAETVNG